MENNIISFTEEEILKKALEKKKSTGISISDVKINENLKVRGKVSRGINIEFDVTCSIVGVTEEHIIVDLIKIKILGLPLPQNMLMKYLESNFKTKSAKINKGKIYASKLAITKKFSELKGSNILDVYLANNSINIKTEIEEKYSIG